MIRFLLALGLIGALYGFYLDGQAAMAKCQQTHSRAVCEYNLSR